MPTVTALTAASARKCFFIIVSLYKLMRNSCIEINIKLSFTYDYGAYMLKFVHGLVVHVALNKHTPT